MFTEWNGQVPELLKGYIIIGDDNTCDPDNKPVSTCEKKVSTDDWNRSFYDDESQSSGGPDSEDE